MSDTLNTKSPPKNMNTPIPNKNNPDHTKDPRFVMKEDDHILHIQMARPVVPVPLSPVWAPGGPPPSTLMSDQSSWFQPSIPACFSACASNPTTSCSMTSMSTCTAIGNHGTASRAPFPVLQRHQSSVSHPRRPQQLPPGNQCRDGYYQNDDASSLIGMRMPVQLCQRGPVRSDAREVQMLREGGLGHPGGRSQNQDDEIDSLTYPPVIEELEDPSTLAVLQDQDQRAIDEVKLLDENESPAGSLGSEAANKNDHGAKMLNASLTPEQRSAQLEHLYGPEDDEGDLLGHKMPEKLEKNPAAEKNAVLSRTGEDSASRRGVEARREVSSSIHEDGTSGESSSQRGALSAPRANRQPTDTQKDSSPAENVDRTTTSETTAPQNTTCSKSTSRNDEKVSSSSFIDNEKQTSASTSQIHLHNSTQKTQTAQQTSVDHQSHQVDKPVDWAQEAQAVMDYLFHDDSMCSEKTWDLLAFPGGCLFAITMGSIGYALFPMGDPFQHQMNWWHCLMPCGITWLALFNVKVNI